MFKINDSVIHCREGLSEIVGSKDMNGKEYFLVSVKHNSGETIYVPVDTASNIIRPLMNEKEADNLLSFVKKIEKELSDIIEVINETKMSLPKDTMNIFWNMFIIDALIGNTDRHNGNWGFLYNVKEEIFCFSPIYDCGSCLNPLLDDEEIKKLASSDIKNLALNCHSCLKEGNQKINYISYIESMKND